MTDDRASMCAFALADFDFPAIPGVDDDTPDLGELDRLASFAHVFEAIREHTEMLAQFLQRRNFVMHFELGLPNWSRGF